MSGDFAGADLAQAALRHSTSSQCQVIVRHSGTANLRWAANSLTTNGLVHDVSMHVIAFDDRPDGIAVASLSGSVHDIDQARALVEQADAAARLAPLAEDASDHPAAATDDAFARTGVALAADRLEQAAAGLAGLIDWAEGHGVEVFGYAEADLETTWFASTSGARLRHEQPTGRLEITAKSHGRSRSTWLGRASVDLVQAEWLAMRAEIEQALAWQSREIALPPGRYRTVLPPAAVADLMVDLAWNTAARDAVEGRTAFHAETTPTGTRIGQLVADARVRLSTDPHDPLASGCPFALASSSSRYGSVFDNGRPLEPTALIDDGVLRHLVAGSADGARYDVPVAMGFDPLRTTVAGATAGSIDDLVATLDDGLLLTCVWYTRSVDPSTMLITGLTRDGVYAVRGGEVVGCVSNFRFNDSPLAMLSRVAAATTSDRCLPREMADYANRVVAPALVVDDFNLTSVSDAR